MNLLTDIETFSISSQTDTTNNKFLKHEIQLLIDEILILITANEQQNDTTGIYLKMFESWLSSSKDSPLLVHFINRLSRSLADRSSSPHYLLELCIQVFFETDHGQDPEITSQKPEDKLFPDIRTLNTYASDSLGWQQIMDNIEFKLNFSGYEYQVNSRTILNPNVNLFEYKFFEDASYLLLYAYLIQRLAMFKASYGEESEQFVDIVLNYAKQVLTRFGTSYKTCCKEPSRPEPGNEVKFCLIVKFLLEVYLMVLVKTKGECESQVGEALVQLSNLLGFYGEDVLSNQNPLNTGQSIGSDLLSSIG